MARNASITAPTDVSRYSQLLLEQFFLVPYYHLSVNVNLGHSGGMCQVEHLLMGSLVLGNIEFLIFYSVLVKELLDSGAPHSARGRIYFHHVGGGWFLDWW